MCAGGCRIRTQRTVSTRANRARAGLGCRHPSAPEGVSGRCEAHLADYQSPRETTKAPRARYPVDCGRTNAGQRQMESRELAQRDERSVESISRATKLRSLASNVPQGRRNTILPISLRRRICAHWPPPSRLDGFVSRAHQQLKEELGLDHFEGRSWQGLHRHAPMTMIAYAFLQHRRLAYAGRKKRINGPPPQPTMPAVRHAIVDLILRPPSQRCPYCRKQIFEKHWRK